MLTCCTDAHLILLLPGHKHDACVIVQDSGVDRARPAR